MRVIKKKLFPSIEEVFVKPQSYYKYVFFPLLSIQLSGKVWVHFISIYGIGNPEIPQPDAHVKYCFAKFIREEDKYKFEGSMDWVENYESLPEWYKEAEEEYLANKVEYLKEQDFKSAQTCLYAQNKQRRMKENEEQAFYIDGLLNYWITRDKYIETGKFIQGGHYTEAHSGHEREILEKPDKEEIEYISESAMHYLGKLNESIANMSYIRYVHGYDYMANGGDSIHLYLSADNKEVLLYFEWS